MLTEQLMEFVRQCAFSEDESELRVKRALSPDYWRSLSQAMTISTSIPEPEVYDAGMDLSAPIEDYKQYGHCKVDEAFPATALDSLKSAIYALHEAGWPMIFAFVYDQIWNIVRTPKLNTFVQSLLGPGFQPTISFWVNYVPPKCGGSGFTPHQDDVRPGHHSVTCWLPLTRATLDNGCIYVIEKIPGGALPEFVDAKSFSAADVCRTLIQVRALPANPGSFLAWPNDTIHWGSMFLRGEQGRLALSWHFASSDYENVDSDLPLALLPGQPLPPFVHRLRWACQSMLRFRARDPFLERFATVAHRVLETCGAAT